MTEDRNRSTTASSRAWKGCVVGILCCVAFASHHAQAGEVQLNGHTFTLPDGFQIELAAGPPLIQRPITAAFDDQGRLYVSDSSGSNEKVQEQLEKKPHRILRLEDSNGDGLFDKSVVFADRMMFPEGTMWLDGSLYVAAPPSLWKLTDTDGDGVADQREEWFQGKTLTGCANDLHGPYCGPDGWIYWCKGAFAEQSYTIQGKSWTTKASHIFRCRPDGSALEPVMTGGMDNPVDTVFLPNGDRVFTTTFLIQPGNGQRDGLIHAIYGGVYGKEHGVLEGHARTGELMPVLAHLGAAAPCGLTHYDSPSFGPAYADNVFACQFNMHKVSRHVLTPQGASYGCVSSDFVVSNLIDFHPTDVLMDADGSLLIVDTGGWYKLCCPTSQLHKPDILGGLYRVRRTDGPAVNDPRGQQIVWNELPLAKLALLAGDDRPEVRQRATGEMASRWSNTSPPNLARAVAEVRQTVGKQKSQAHSATSPELVERNLLWALARLDTPAARSVTRRLLDDPNLGETSRQIALHAVSLWRDRAAAGEVLAMLDRESPTTRRLACEALGRIATGPEAVAALLQAASRLQHGTESDEVVAKHDRALEHALAYALIEIASPHETAKGLESDSVWTRRVALLALDQMPDGGLQPERVTALLEAPEAPLRETAHWIISRHPQWGAHVSAYFVARLSQTRPNVDQAEDQTAAALESQLVRFAASDAIQETLAKAILETRQIPLTGRLLALRAMAHSRLKEMPAVWGDALAQVIDQNLSDGAAAGEERSAKQDVVSAPRPEVLAAAVAAARELPQPKQPFAALNQALAKVAGSEWLDARIRLDAMAAVAGGMPSLADSQFELLQASLLPDKPVAERAAATQALSRAKLSPAQLHALAETIKSVGPLELNQLLTAFERSPDEAVGLKLVASLKQALALSSLRLDSLQQNLAKYSPPVQQGVGELVALLNAEAALQRERIEELLPQMAQGDIRRGQAVFNSTKAACTACHRIGYLGGNSGPDLTRIGGIRTERDLLESILYPSLSFVRSYEPVVVITNDGRIVNGLVRNETANELVITTGPNQETRLAHEDIEEMRPSTVSVMPAGLEKQLTTQELADLVAFLKNAK